MSLFRKPKKPIQRRVFSGYSDEEADIENNEKSSNYKMESMDIDDDSNSRSSTGARDKKKLSMKKSTKDKTQTPIAQPPTKSSLLSFDDEEEGEVFQVKKSSHSKKVMKMLDKERRKKKHKSSNGDSHNLTSSSQYFSSTFPSNQINSGQSTSSSVVEEANDNNFSDIQEFNSNLKVDKRQKSENSNSIQTEIRTDDFVLVVKKSEPENLILNGRAALCAGKDDLSSEDDDDQDGKKSSSGHKFNHPDNFKKVLESGAIPDAAMIHAARKRRQKAREQSEFIPVEEPPPERKGNRLLREDAEDDCSEDEERVDMSAITGIKEREERREKFYSAQQEYSGEESDPDMNEWENQQIRKGVTGAQLVAAHQESIYSQFMIQPINSGALESTNLSTGALLEQAYAKSSFEKPRQVLLATQQPEKNKPSAPRMPNEVLQNVRDRLTKLKEINEKHYTDIENLDKELKLLKVDVLDCEQKVPVVAGKYKFYQEIRCYITDLTECLDEKIPLIGELEKKIIAVMSKRTLFLVERRRQDVRDQAKEIADLSKTGIRKGPEDDDHTRRAAEREGRRTRRRRDRERNELNEIHLDGMSSDDESADHEVNTHKLQLEQILNESEILFGDTAQEFCHIDEILRMFESWKTFDLDSYREAYVTICLPKIIGPFIRLKLIGWSPLDEQSQDIEKMHWYNIIMKYGYMPNETELSLENDPDIGFVPAVIEKIILPKLTEYIENCWDPLSTTQTLRLVGQIARLGREYPSLRPSANTFKTLFVAILDKMKLSLENDVFIPIFPKHMQEAKTSFFQRQFCSGLKLLRNFISWQGIISDTALKDIAILSLLNRYLLSAMRVCTPSDAISKAYIIVNTLPRVWLNSDCGILESMEMFIMLLKHVANQLDKKNPTHMESIEKITKILDRLHATL